MAIECLVGMHLGKVQIWAGQGMGADMININEAKQAFHLQYTNMDNKINIDSNGIYDQCLFFHICIKSKKQSSFVCIYFLVCSHYLVSIVRLDRTVWDPWLVTSEQSVKVNTSKMYISVKYRTWSRDGL